MRKHLRYIFYSFTALAIPVIWKLLETGIVLAHDCSSEGDCLQTAGYNAVTSIGGGIIAILAALLGAHFAGLGGTETLEGVAPESGPSTDGAAAQPPGTVLDADGNPLTNWDPKYGPGKDGNPGKPGDVWDGDNWVSPEQARQEIQELIQERQQREREIEQRIKDDREWIHQQTVDMARRDQLEADRERAEHQEQKDAFETLQRISNIADRHGYDDISDRIDWERDAYNPDGSINVDYVDKLKDILGDRVGRDSRAPDDQNQGWFEDFAENTINDARHSTLIRIGTGILSGGTSEVFYQSQAAYEAMERTYDQAAQEGREGDLGFTDMLLTGGRQLVRENLPVNIIETCMDPNATTTDILIATAMDMFTAMDTADTFQNLRGSMNSIRQGGNIMDALTHRAPGLDFFPGSEPEIPGGALDGTGGARGLDEASGGTRSIDSGRADLETGGARGLDEAGGGTRSIDSGRADLETGGARGLDEAGGGTKNLDEATVGPRNLDEVGDGTKGLDEAGGGTKNLDEAGGGRADEGGGARAEEGGGARAEEGGGAKAEEGGGARTEEGGPPPKMDDLPPNTPVTPGQAGIPDANARGIQQTADELDVDIEMRQTNPDATVKLEQGYPPKDCHIKNKTGTELDEMLGAPPGHRGEAMIYEPKLPDGYKSYDDLPPDLKSRYNQRFEEYAVQGPKIQELVDKKLIKVEDGVIINTGLNPDPKFMNKPFAGDHDIFKITPRDGSKLTPELEQAVVGRLSQNGNGGHGSHLSEGWNPRNPIEVDARAGIANKHLPVEDGGGGEALIKFSPGQQPKTSFASAPEVSRLPTAPDIRTLERFDEASRTWIKE